MSTINSNWCFSSQETTNIENCNEENHYFNGKNLECLPPSLLITIHILDHQYLYTFIEKKNQKSILCLCKITPSVNFILCKNISYKELYKKLTPISMDESLILKSINIESESTSIKNIAPPIQEFIDDCLEITTDLSDDNSLEVYQWYQFWCLIHDYKYVFSSSQVLNEIKNKKLKFKHVLSPRLENLVQNKTGYNIWFDTCVKIMANTKENAIKTTILFEDMQCWQISCMKNSNMDIKYLQNSLKPFFNAIIRKKLEPFISINGNYVHGIILI
jgi:hypothetical protein